MKQLDKLKVSQLINEHWYPKNKGCEMCGHKNWILGKNIIETNQLNVPDEKIQFIILVCDKCANTKFINKDFV